MHVPNEKIAKEKNTITIHKILHKLLEAIKIFYEICRVLKAILNLFLESLAQQKADAPSICFLL